MKKIIVCGGPHSGKSVFLCNLKELLPRTGYFLFRCCPDGEGTWSSKADQQTVKEIRVKGKFNETFMQYVLSGLDNLQANIPIVLVDVGGVMSKENTEIFKRCDYFIVLSSKEDEIDQWVKFGIDLGLQPLAILKSDLYGSESIEGTEGIVKGTVAGLERGTYQLGSQLLGAVAEKINNIISFEKEISMTNLSENQVTFTIDGLAMQIGKEKTPRTLPNGKTIEMLSWNGEDLQKLDSEIYRPASAQPGSYVLDGPAPAWMALGFSHGMHPQSAFLNDPRLGAVEIISRKPSYEKDGEGKNLKFTMTENGDFTVVEFEILGGTFNVEDLESVRAPKVNCMKGVVLSGRGPNWLVATIGMAYHTTRWVACWQPGNGATVAMTHHSSQKLGDIIPEEKILAARQPQPVVA